MNNYTDMTDEEYDALDEALTRNPPRIISNGSDWLSQREMRFLGLTNLTINYLLSKAEANHKNLAQIIEELVRKDIAAAL
jgi:hypothetical protein